jgi:hypothetical protein
MKKILVVLLVLAAAGGVFAQEGDWSFDGTAEIGFIVNLDPMPGATDDPALATSSYSQYNMPYDGWDGVKGKFGINYSRDGFGAGVTIRTISPSDDTFIGNLNYAGEGFYFNVESSLASLINGGSSFKQLWGNYEFVNGMVFLEASYVRGWAGNYWSSDQNGAFRDWNGRGNNVIPGALGGGETFTMRDGGWEGGPSSYIIGDIRLEGLSFGLMIRDIFLKEKSYRDRDTGVLYERVGMTFVDDVLKKMIFGVKFEQSPVEVAAQFLMEDYGVYVGGKFFAGPITAGLSFMGIMGAKELDRVVIAPFYVDDDGNQHYVVTEKTYRAAETTQMKIGGGVNYDADGFGASINGYYAVNGNKDVEQVSAIGIQPGFYYNVIPSHLQFKLDAGFYFYTFYAGGEEVTDGVNTVQYALQPQLFWNFLGTGAGGYGGTGIFIRYRMVGGDPTKDAPIGFNNKFDVNFKFSF